ncbi:CcoQ/FixQ family Cbb3-type cytochrome c oxidase assembly chaperone [Dechloromonas sp. TW-R-39-2]|jgi:cytochrome c oxidase cbb3-type subunit 4|uniref:cbb3-type cytochrome oxidase subunit 3 n=1 Tax=Dechloromonas TaxID=73029 RepID=UPI00193CCDC1|nr:MULTISPECIES: cbb3-type cytochrome c oxidase subunit 3 [Dechloromonas]QRM20540.1 CcoQ/FixQ family Cbb3-type cytochrome c oxidase assembly chaperone [Dechloromonas sp. TW-R-39-2]UCV10974.1 cbb3-type cytochrome c oxidase subunit 3 [Dechloromonas denitrificans]
MDINDLRSITTVLGLLCFLGIVAWAYGKGSKKGFEEAANLPFAGNDDDGAVSRTSHQR